MDEGKHLLGVTSLEGPAANLDIMYIEKNYCDNIIITVMDVPGKTKDNAKARLDVAGMCDSSELNLKHGANGEH